MSKTESSPSSRLSENSGERTPMPKSFRTAKGSVYTYDEEGKTTRFKTTTGEQCARQDITVFVHLNSEMEDEILSTIHLEYSPRKPKIYVVERQEDDTARIIRDVEEIADPSKLSLALFENGRVVKHAPASLHPIEGHSVFDMRSFDHEGRMLTERHLGNQVVEINYG